MLKHKFITLGLILLTPFFSLADIWTDGTVDKQSPKIFSASACSYRAPITDLGYTELASCVEQVKQIFHDERVDTSSSITVGYVRSVSFSHVDHISLYYTYERCTTVDYQNNTCLNWADIPYHAGYYNINDTQTTSQCPNDNYPNHTYPKHDENGDVIYCADPEQLEQLDLCNLSNTNEYLPIMTQTVLSGCFESSNGASCKYNAIDVGNGLAVYALDFEGSCYTEELPSITGTQESTPQNQYDNCTQYGTGLACPEDQSNVCDSNGVCPDGCGTVNEVFVCFDNDFDSDSVPDYLDPDIDGDGIPNDQDLDSDGDGVDDPIDLSSGSSSGTGDVNVEVNIDTQSITDELQSINSSLSVTNTQTDLTPSENLESLWQSNYENGFSGMFQEKIDEIKSTDFFNFLENFKGTDINGGTSAIYDMCFNLGAMGNFGCHNFNIDPRVFPAIKVFMLIFAGFACRRIIFGG